MAFQKDWPHGHTSDGLKAEILKTNGNGPSGESILVLITGVLGTQFPRWFYEDGRYEKSKNTSFDLVNAPASKRKLEAWVNFYEDAEPCVFPTKTQADKYCVRRLACIHVTGEEGDGLE